MGSLSHQTDYLLFSAAAIAVFAAAQWWLVRQRAGRMPVLAWVIALAVLAAGAFATERAGFQARTNLAGMVRGYAPTYAAELTRLGHAGIPLSAHADEPLYRDAVAAQLRWLAANDGINDIYTVRRSRAGQVQFIVDSETDYDRNGRFEGEREARTAIGEHFDLKSAALDSAFAGHGSFADEPYQDRWGVWVSAFWPLLDSKGHVEAVVGVDYAAASWLSAIASARRGVMWMAAIILVLLLAATTIIALLRVQLEHREQTQRALTEAKDAAEHANRIKSQFLANMSHEIRTPIHGILGLSELLLNTALTEKQSRWAQLINSSVNALRSVVNDILDYSKIEANKVQLEHVDFSPRQLLIDAIDLHAPSAVKKAITLTTEVDPSVPTQINGDPTRLGQVLNNLISNAIKFTAQGGVHIQLRAREESNGVRLRFAVLDSGPGIPLDVRGGLFQPFMQADGSTTRKHGGTGLGLAICKELVALMQGRIDFEPRPEGGSRFSFDALLLPALGKL